MSFYRTAGPCGSHLLNRRSLSLLGFSATLVLSSMLCNTEVFPEVLPIDQDIFDENERAVIADAATDDARRITETALASITPSVTPTSIPTDTPTPTPSQTPEPPATVPDDLHAIFSATDEAGDTYLCDTGETVDDRAVDIIIVEVFDPSSVGSDHDGLLVRVEFGDPAIQTYTNDWSFSLNGAFASPGETVYTIIINEIHAGVISKGTLNETGQNILSGTQDRTYIDEQGNIWFLIPGETTFIQIASFHTPTDDLPPEQKRRDLAPSDGTVYTIQSHP